MPNERADVVIDEEVVELIGTVEAEDITLEDIGSLRDAIRTINERLDGLEEE